MKTLFVSTLIFFCSKKSSDRPTSSGGKLSSIFFFKNVSFRLCSYHTKARSRKCQLRRRIICFGDRYWPAARHVIAFGVRKAGPVKYTIDNGGLLTQKLEQTFDMVATYFYSLAAFKYFNTVVSETLSLFIFRISAKKRYIGVRFKDRARGSMKPFCPVHLFRRFSLICGLS